MRGCAVVRDGDATIVAIEPDEVRSASGADAFAPARRRGTRRVLGRVPRLRPRPSRSNASAPECADDLDLPDVVLARYDARLVLRPGAEPEVVGDGHGRGDARAGRVASARGRDPRPYRGSSAWTSSLDQAALDGRRSGAILELLDGRRVLPGEPHPPAHRATAPPIPSRSTRALARAQPGAARGAAARSAPRLPDARGRVGVARALPARRRPRASRPGRSRAPAPTRAALRAQRQGPRRERDDRRPRAQRPRPRVRARLDRRSPTLCAVEAHPGLHHLVSTVRGTAARRRRPRRRSCAATFPPASVTGAPKPRVLQVIEDLEPVRRGVYCGAVGWIDTRTRHGPTSPSRSARSRSPAGATTLGVGGGHRRRLAAGRRVGGDRAQGGAAAALAAPARSVRETSASVPVIVWIDGALDAVATRRASRRSTTASSSATACSRRCACYDGVPFAWRRHLDRLRALGRRARPRAARRRRRCATRPTRCSRPTTCARRGCGSRSPAGRAPLGSERGDGRARP